MIKLRLPSIKKKWAIRVELGGFLAYNIAYAYV